MKVALKTLGCKANQYESNQLIESLITLGCSIVDIQDEPDIYIVNTCTVTHVADRKSRQAIRSLKHLSPNSKMIVFGCGAKKKAGNNYQSLPEINYVCEDPEEILRLVQDLNDSIILEPNEWHQPELRTRAIIKIQDGCNNFCSYCIVPYVRGREVSFPLEKILAEIKFKEDQGFQEIVLTGINAGSYNDQGVKLAGLIRKILNETKIPRLRLSSLEPQNYEDDFLDVFKNERFCPHLHLSLQSGTDRILKLMRRNYSTDDYLAIGEKLRKIRPDLALTTDIIVGFPGETEEDFLKTIEFVKKIGFLKIHVFPYSSRKNTLAGTFKDKISDKVKNNRSKVLLELEKEMGIEFKRKFLNRTKKVLFEAKKDGKWIGFTDNYIKVGVISEKNLENKIREVQLQRIRGDGAVEGRITIEK